MCLKTQPKPNQTKIFTLWTYLPNTRPCAANDPRSNFKQAILNFEFPFLEARQVIKAKELILLRYLLIIGGNTCIHVFHKSISMKRTVNNLVE